MKSKKAPVSFHDSPPDKSLYQSAIERAKAKSRAKPGDMENTPRFDSIPLAAATNPPPRPVKEALSPSTVAGLSALAEAQPVVDPQVEKEEEEAQLAEEAAAQEEVSDDVKLQKKVEARVSSLDIGHYLMGGDLLQTVPIIPGKLTVVFRTMTDLEEVYVDDKLSENPDVNARQYLRKNNEWALAMHIHSLNGKVWPTIFDGDGTVNDKAVTQRLASIRRLHSPVMNLLIQNLGWFMNRVNSALTMEALGNG